MKRYFGTDGIRGRVGESPVSPVEILKLGWAAGRVLAAGRARGRVIIGKDTRISGYLLESALEAGLSAAGVDISLTGPLPTPAIAFLTRQAGACAGIVISASHNPYHDNGIKFFSEEGRKLPDEVEVRIEQLMGEEMVTVGAEALGKAERFIDAIPRYTEHCRDSLAPGSRLDGLKLAVDCANGAAYHVAPLVLRELGAEVTAIGTEPDGFNINRDGGSTAPEAVRKLVLDNGSDAGIAFDGDADRVILVDHQGEIVDGDGILYVLSQHHLQQEGAGGLVGTAMTNLGVEVACKKSDIPFSRAQVGDRYILEQLTNAGWILGGETSGHILCLDRSTTGDGLIAALAVLEIMVQTQKSLAELVAGLKIYPQQLINVSLGADAPAAPSILGCGAVKKAIAQCQSQLGDEGRVVLRPSGTEPVIRVMVEGVDAEMVDELARQIATAVQRAAGTPAVDAE
ncbi:MAG: phosphoglucosamine mutase [Arenicellales bacterium]|nr:phosphoglucosamine mutase [Arenicellales bacterium]|tara:strand:- start:1347 stop:2714 length:1368 start_codon:yes stop_codon:yes gene_type:complete